MRRLARRSAARPACWTAALAVATACGGGDREVAGPPQPGGGPPDLAELTVRVTLEPSQSALGAILGWSDGVPAADLHLLRNGTATWKTATTDPSGRATFETLLPDRYRVWAGRRLSASEAQATGGAIRAFGDGRTFDLAGGDNELELTLSADDPGGLVRRARS